MILPADEQLNTEEEQTGHQRRNNEKSRRFPPKPENTHNGETIAEVRRNIKRGWSQVPVPYRQKKPIIKGWPDLRITEENLSEYFNGEPINIGVLLGPASGGLQDVDLDAPEAVRIARYFLPDTATFGRTSKPQSHWLYISTFPSTIQFKDPTAPPDEAMIVEIRSTPVQTIFPRSIHEDGEPIKWDQDTDPITIDREDLHERVKIIAALSLLSRYWPPGGRHSAALALAGGLLQAGISVEKTRKYIEIIAETAGDEEIEDRLKAVQTTAARLESGGEVTGWTQLEELLDKRIIDRTREWLGIRKQVFSAKVPVPIAKAFLDQSYRREFLSTLRYYADTFMEWRGNCYQQKENNGLRSEVYTFLDDAKEIIGTGDNERIVPFQTTKHKVDLIVDALKAESYLPSQITPPAWLTNDSDLTPASELLVCRSSIIHLPTMKILEPTPKLFVTNALPIDFDPDAQAPELWLEFLSGLWPNDPESIDTLQEWFGYLLVTDTRLQKMLLLIGPKRSGKGTIGRVLVALLGIDNVAGPTASSLATQFGLQPLIGKSLATVSDARFKGGSDQGVLIERLLSISGEDTLSIPRKFLPDVTMKLPTRIMLLTNELPRLADSSGALAGRFIILRLIQSFYGKEDPMLTDKLVQELPGILNWAIEGWGRLRERVYFLQPKSATDVVQDLEDLSSPITAFIKDRCVIGPEHQVETQELFAAWRNWCGEHGRDFPGTDASFGRDLGAAVPGLRKKRPRSQLGSRTSVYFGIGLV